MKEIFEVTDWLATQESASREIPRVSDLANPRFEHKNQPTVSFGSNNYQTANHDQRLIAVLRDHRHSETRLTPSFSRSVDVPALSEAS
jgi:hypothetical protein